MNTNVTNASSSSLPRQRRLIILTLKKHKDGIWIHKLVQALEETKLQRCRDGGGGASATTTTTTTTTIEVQVLEDWLGEGFVVSSSSSTSSSPTTTLIFHNVIGIVNRVSDAASPSLFKACCAILQTAQLLHNIPVVNGPTSYQLCANKWCHHILFQKANLSSPTTMTFFAKQKSDSGDEDEESEKTKEVRNENICKTFIINSSDENDENETTSLVPNYDLLIKPNAGGFGAGIRRLKGSRSDTTIDDLKFLDDLPTNYEDSMYLLQKYEQPYNNKLYRIWFLQGKIQCAIERSIISDDNEDDDTQFTNGCAAGGGGTCSIIRPSNQQGQKQGRPSRPSPLSSSQLIEKMKPWKVPVGVQEEIENQLLPLLKDAHCGSVEFLYNSSSSSSSPSNKNDNQESSSSHRDDHQDEKNKKRLYFDLNLLSTLPIVENLYDDDDNNNDVWGKNYDPWSELAETVWNIVVRGNNSEQAIS